ncbi:hypothetical protein, partial [Celeribacter halophilus]
MSRSLDVKPSTQAPEKVEQIKAAIRACKTPGEVSVLAKRHRDYMDELDAIPSLHVFAIQIKNLAALRRSQLERS